MAVNNSLQSRSGGKPKFSVAIQTPMYQKLVIWIAAWARRAIC